MRALALALSVAHLAVPAAAQDTVEAFYQGQTVTMVIGAPVGGGFDTYARLIARHMAKYIPGQPTIVPENMPGSGSNTAASYIYSVAPQDGSYMAALLPGAIIEPLLGRFAARHDPSKLHYLGNANSDVYVCLARTDAQVQSFDDLFETELIIGGSGSGASTRDFPNLLRNLIDARLTIVGGYPGTADIINAVERGEVQGQCGTAWASISASHGRWFDDGTARVLVQESLTPHPDLDGVPLAIDFAESEEERQIMELIYSQPLFGRPFVVGPGVPEERTTALREAFWKAVQDPELLAEAERARLEVNPLSGEELQDLVVQLFQSPPDLIESAKAALADE